MPATGAEASGSESAGDESQNEGARIEPDAADEGQGELGAPGPAIICSHRVRLLESSWSPELKTSRARLAVRPADVVKLGRSLKVTRGLVTC